MTGRNVSNLAPLLHQWKMCDRVVLVPTSEAPAQQTDWFLQRLQWHGMAASCKSAPLLPSHPNSVADWLQRGDVKQLLLPTLPAIPAAQDRPDAAGAHAHPVNDTLQLVGNGGTKPLQDMLRTGLGCLQGGSPVVVAYAEARPARLLLLQEGSAARQEAWPKSNKGMITLDDVLGVCGHLRPTTAGLLLWSAGQPTQAGRTRCPTWPPADLAAQGQGWRADKALTVALRHQVAGAVLDLLASQPALADITAQVWLAPEAHVTTEQTPRARWDLLLLLRNGVLVHLDCSRWHPQARDDCHTAMQALVDTTAHWVPLPPSTNAAGTAGTANSLAEHCRQTLLQHHRLGRKAQAWLWPGSELNLGNGLCLTHRPDWIEQALLDVLAPYLPKAD